MKEVEELSLKEIATTLNIDLANVKIRLYRSKEFGFNSCDRVTESVMKGINTKWSTD